MSVSFVNNGRAGFAQVCEWVSSFNSNDKYQKRPEELVIRTSDGEFTFRKPTLKYRTTPEIDGTLKDYLFSVKDGFSVTGHLSAEGRMWWFGLEWNGDISRSGKLIRATFAPPARGVKVPSLRLIEVFQCSSFGDVECSRREEVLTIVDGKVTKRETDLSVQELVELARELPKYDKRTNKVKFVIEGVTYDISLGNNPDRVTALLFEHLKKIGSFELYTTLPSNGLLQLFRIITPLGEWRGGEKGIFSFEISEGQFKCVQASYMCKAPSLNGCIAFTQKLSPKIINIPLSTEDLMKEVTARAEQRKTFKEIFVAFEGNRYAVKVAPFHRSDLEDELLGRVVIIS